jgi:hypothetical protein
MKLAINKTADLRHVKTDYDKHMTRLLKRYEFESFIMTRQGDGHYTAHCFNGSKSVRVYRVPSSSGGTAEHHVAQNILKRAKLAKRQGFDMTSYKGGK